MFFPDPNFSSHDPGFRLKKAPDPDPQQGLQAFLTK
jgi:hypothetical protein